MDIQGSLEAMNLPTLVQFVAQGGQQAVIQLEHNQQLGRIYLKNGQLYHAELQNPNGEAKIGEGVVYELLSWQSGTFEVIRDVRATDQTIEQSYDFLLMEGLRLIDEGQAHQVDNPQSDSLGDMLNNLSTSEQAIMEEILAQQKENNIMSNIKETLSQIMEIDGAMAAALVDWESGLTLGTIGSGFDIDLAAAGNTNVIRSKMSVMKDLKLNGGIEDVLITLTDQYHLIRMMEGNEHLFIYLALNRNNANLGLARHRLSSLTKELSV